MVLVGIGENLQLIGLHDYDMNILGVVPLKNLIQPPKQLIFLTFIPSTYDLRLIDIAYFTLLYFGPLWTVCSSVIKRLSLALLLKDKLRIFSSELNP